MTMSNASSAADSDDTRRSQAPKPLKSPVSAKIASQYAHDSRHQVQVAAMTLDQQLDLIKQFGGSELTAELVSKFTADLMSHNKVARNAVRALGEMMEDMILYIRLGAGSPVPVDKKGLMLGPMMMRIADARGQVAQERGIALKVKPSRMAIITDQRTFNRVMCNLIDNAINHANATKIVVGMRMQGENCVLEVADNGRGIAESEQEKIFEAGYRGSSAGGPNWSEGRGLGLYIVKSLVEQLEGSIELWSKPGKGARFRVILPGPIEWQERGINAGKSEQTTLTGKTIAVLEDHLETLRLYESAFASRGAKVIASDNVAEWVSKVVNAKKIPDLILVDFMIGRGTSDLALQMLRSRLRDSLPKGTKKGAKSVAGLPIVIVTGNPGHPQLKELSKNTPVLQKPLNQQSIDTLTQVAAGKRALNAADFIN